MAFDSEFTSADACVQYVRAKINERLDAAVQQREREAAHRNDPLYFLQRGMPRRPGHGWRSG